MWLLRNRALELQAYYCVGLLVQYDLIKVILILMLIIIVHY